jgi:DNA-binding MarR family transcriptional regulator
VARVPAPEDLTVEAVRALARVARLLERSTGALSLAQYRVLAAVASGHGRASRIAERLALGKPAISAAVEALSQRGLLLRGEVADDQRASALSLTAEGRAVLLEVETTMADELTSLVARRPDPDRLVAALAELGVAVDEMIGIVR